MGQGAESCGGYEVEYEPHFDNENIGLGVWHQKDGSTIKVSDMKVSHIRNTKRMCEKMRDSSSFSCDADSWQCWVDIFDEELNSRSEMPFHIAKYTSPEKAKPTRGAKIELICHCGKTYSPRVADLKRGYGMSCCKRCASIKREYGRPDSVCANTGMSIKKLLEGLK